MIGLLLRDTTLLAKYPLKESDFVDYEYQIKKVDEDGKAKTEDRKIGYNQLFKCIESAYTGGKQHMDPDDTVGAPIETIRLWVDRALPVNVEYYYNSIRKTTVLREAAKQGRYLPKYTWHGTDDIKTHELFNKIDLDDLITEVAAPMGQLVIDQNYGKGKSSWDSGCGSPNQYLIDYLEKKPWGVSTMSPLLNSLIHGWCRNTFYEIIASSGVGKSMMSYSNIAYGYLKELYDDGKWSETGNKQSCLYIGTEMDLKEQVLPQIACCAGYTNYQHAIKRSFTEDEWDRFSEAVERIYSSDSVFLVKESDYDRIKLGNLVDGYIKSHNIQAVFLDYMEVTSSMADKYKDDVKILNELAGYCKDVLSTKDIAMIAFAQANKNLGEMHLNEIDANCIKGSHTIHLKADVLIYLLPGGTHDYEYLLNANTYDDIKIHTALSAYEDKGIYNERYYQGMKNYKAPKPERIRKILIGDKCRPDTSKRGYCVWCFVEDGTLRWHDLFVTDSEYRLVNVAPTYLRDGEVTDSKSFKGGL